MLQIEKDIVECNFVGFPLNMADNEDEDRSESKGKAAEDKAVKDKAVVEDKANENTAEVKAKCRKHDENKDGTDDKVENEDKSDKDDAKVTVDEKSQKVKYKNKIEETDIDTGKVEAACRYCATLLEENNSLKEENRNLSKILDESLKTSENTISELKEQLKYSAEQKKLAEERYSQMKHRSDEITATMAEVFDAKVELENINDEFSNTKLAKRFESVYSNKWPSLTEWLFDNIEEINEIKMIKHLTSLIKKAYETCNSISEHEIRVFLALEADEPVPTSRENPLLYKVKRKHGKTEKRRKAIKKSVWEVISKEKSINELLTEEQNETTKEGEAKFEEFFNDFTDICWLMTISQPKLILNFDVIGQLYEGSVRDRFKQYACQDTVTDMSKVKNAITEVVWPSVELEDGSGIHTKGDVIVVEEGMEKEEANEIETDEDVNAEKGKNTDGKNKKRIIKKGSSYKGNNEERIRENGPGKEGKGRKRTSEKGTKEKRTPESKNMETECYQEGSSETETSDEDMTE